VAFEDANNKKACKGHDFCDMVYSFVYHNTMGSVFSAGADHSRKTRHYDVL
jgi:hypothetical protein